MADKLAPPPDVSSDRFPDWLFKLRKLVNDLSVPETVSTSNLSDAQAALLKGGGDTSLHFHSSDRNRANHTGTQTASTISDLDDFVQARVSSAASTGGGTDYLGCQAFGP